MNFGSMQGDVGITLSISYTTGKHAVTGLTRTASEGDVKDGLRIHALCPGYSETSMKTRSPLVLKAMQEQVSTAVPMQQIRQAKKLQAVFYV